MKQLNGVVEVHGDNIEVTNHNNLKCAIIEGASTYDIYCYLKEQDTDIKMDLIKELSKTLNNISRVELVDYINTIKPSN